MTHHWMVLDHEQIIWSLGKTRQEADGESLKRWHESEGEYEDSQDYFKAKSSFITLEMTDRLFQLIEKEDISKIDSRMMRRQDGIYDIK
jgi:hypothetical protein